MKNKIRIGILLDDFNIPYWSYVMLETIIKSSSSEIVLLIKNKSTEIKKQNKLNWLRENRRNIAYLTFRKLDKILFKCIPDAFDQKNILNILTVDTLKVQPDKTKSCDYINDIDLNEIRKYKIDIFIKLGFRIFQGEILNIARYGVWSYSHGNSKTNRGGSTEFREVLKNHDETVVELRILRNDLYGGTILFKSYSHTSGFSINRNLNNCYWKALSFLPLKIQELSNLGEGEFFKQIDDLNKFPQFYSNQFNKIPSNRELIFSIFGSITSNIKKFIVNKLYFKQWILLYCINKNPNISTSLYKFKKIIPPKDRFWADPHIIKRGDKYYIFIEELIYSKVKAHISLIIMDENGNYTPPVKVLERDYHLSYPFIIEDHGEIYMIPETKMNKTIELYKCTDFPLEWKLETILFDKILAVDTTVLKKDDRYWLFTNILNNEGASIHDELFLFSSERLISNIWESHPQNPIISDVKSARPAGKFFNYKGNLYRPSQNCSKYYGYAMTINSVIEINEFRYKEIVVDSILPDWDNRLLGTHTLNSVENLTFIDAQLKRRR